MSTDSLTIGINLTVCPGEAGGVAQAVMGLIRALGLLEDGDERYLIIAQSEAAANWIKEYMHETQHVVVRKAVPHDTTSWPAVLKRMLGPLRPAAEAIQRLMSLPRYWPEVRISDGFYEGLGCDVIHFPTQGYTVCAVPTVYNPHDLQHCALPQFFTPAEIAARETIYRAGCQFAQTVVVGTQYIKDDVIRQYAIHPDKVQVIAWAPPTEAYQDVSSDSVTATREKHQLDAPFALYPAVTWPHKNHLRLLEALALLRDRTGRRLSLVCTGSRYEPHWPQVEQKVRELNLQSQVRCLGFVPEEELRALYRLAQFLVLPTLYEADSCPIFEAWHEGLPVASSNVTALPDQVLDAGLLFDPYDVEAIAEALERMTTDAALREDLRRRGSLRVRDFSWERTAKAYRAVYRRAARRPLSEEDRWLLNWDWMRQPNRNTEVLV